MKVKLKEEDKTSKVKIEKDSEHEGTFENKQEDEMERKEITIPVFDGEDYNMWKQRIKMFLKFKKCDTVITREKVATDKDDWDEQDLKAINLIYSTISNKQLEFVSEEETAYKIMKRLDSMYLKESTALQIVCRNRLEKMRLINYGNSESFFSEFEKTINELKGAGAKISEKEKLNYMLNTLPESYSYIGDLIDTLKEEDQTADYVRNKIKLAEMKNQNDHSERKSNVFTAKKRQKENCFRCGKFGHFARDCQDGSQAGQNGGTWRGSARGRNRGRPGRSNYGRGRGNFRQQGASTSEQQQSGTGTVAWIATAHVAQQRSEQVV